MSECNWAEMSIPKIRGRAPKWQPIETAPRDGSFMLLAFGGGEIHIGAWTKWGDSSYPFVWVDQTGSCLCREWKDDELPAYWMPLPEPPKEQT